MLATDYDGTLARDGALEASTLKALVRFRDSGRHLVMVTGREIEALKQVCPRLDLFEIIVAENGALLYWPKSGLLKLLCEQPPTIFAEKLREKRATPLSVGHAIVATREPYETTVLDLIKELGLELQVIFNKGAVMVLPAGVNKATGLRAALREIGLSLENTVGVGDAENDHAFLEICAVGVAVSNALPSLKEHADLVTTGERGAGVAELIERVLATDLREVEPHPRRRAPIVIK